MSTQLLVVAVIFLAVFTQSLSGFGVALVAMSLLPALIPIQVAAPLVAVVGLTIEFFLLLRYRSALNSTGCMAVNCSLGIRDSARCMGFGKVGW